MKRLITLLLLLAPALASATDPLCNPQPCGGLVTAGSGVISTTENFASFDVSGRDFTATVSWHGLEGPFPEGAWDQLYPGIPTGYPFGSEPIMKWGADCADSFSMSIGVANGAGTATQGGSPPGSSCGFGTFATTSPITITGAGVYKTGFEMDASAEGPVSCLNNCDQLFHIFGTGIAAMNVVPAPYQPGVFYVSSATVNFGAPEPSTGSLMLVGIVGFVVLRLRRRSRATLLHAG